jgi:sugar lactone lactonase YvrE
MKPRIHVIFILLFSIIGTGSALAQTSTISTVAGNGTAGYSGDGGPGPSAQINGPFGIAVDGAGNVYIAEWYNHRVRKVDTSGTITTIAGIGIAGFGGDGGPATNAALNSPEDVAVDSAGNVYIADSLNNRIRKIDTSGTITTVAGNGIARYTGEGSATEVGVQDPSGLAVDSAGNIYTTEVDNGKRVQKFMYAGPTRIGR